MPMRLPPLNAVRVFDACARHLNFTRAAEELSVTHSAVSKQIAILEDFVGERLFDRSGPRIALTDEGRRLRDLVLPAFAQLHQAFTQHGRQSPGSRILRVTTAASFAAQVLVPALPQINSALPDLTIHVTTSDRPLDLSREAVDVAIRYGKGNWPGLHSEALSPGKLVAVTAADIETSTQTRIQTFAIDEWARVDSSLRPSGDVIMLEQFVVGLEAAKAGLGIALLPDVLVQRSITSEQLRLLPIPAVDWDDAFHFLHHPESRRLADIASFKEALLAAL